MSKVNQWLMNTRQERTKSRTNFNQENTNERVVFSGNRSHLNNFLNPVSYDAISVNNPIFRQNNAGININSWRQDKYQNVLPYNDSTKFLQGLAGNYKNNPIMREHPYLQDKSSRQIIKHKFVSDIHNTKTKPKTKTTAIPTTVFGSVLIVGESFVETI